MRARAAHSIFFKFWVITVFRADRLALIVGAGFYSAVRVVVLSRDREDLFLGAITRQSAGH